MPTMGKADIVAVIAEKTGLTKKEAAAAFEASLEAIAAALKRGDRVQLTGFGIFEVRERQARKGRNVATGETIEIPATKAPVFKAGKALREAIQ